MTKKVRVEVTEEDIKNGKPMSGKSCPVALAINRATGEKVAVVPYASRAAVFPYEVYVNLPRRVCDFAIKFDERRKVKPLAFTLEVPCPASK